METEISNQNSDRIGFRSGMNSKAWRPLAIVVLALLVGVSYGSAQTPSSSISAPSGPPPTTCNATPQGGNGCPSPQYRYGVARQTSSPLPNAGLTGNPVGDKNILNPKSVNQLVLLVPNGTPAPCQSPNSPDCGCQSSMTATYGIGGTTLTVPSPTSSPSIESRLLFPALDANNNCALFTYDLTPSNPQYVSEIGSNPSVSSSPGYTYGEVLIGAEDGNVYAYPFASGSPPLWTFTNPLGYPFDSSPTVWPEGLGFAFVLDVEGDIYFLDPFTGKATYSITSQLVYPGGAMYGNNGYLPPASSLAVSTANNMVLVAGADGSGLQGALCAYDSRNANFLWCNKSPIDVVTSSPVVSDSLGAVYVQSTGSCGLSSEPLLYAVDFKGNGRGSVAPFLPPAPFSCAPSPYSTYLFQSGGSPAYDDSADNGTLHYIIASAYVTETTCVGCYNPHYGTVFDGFQFSVIEVYDAVSGDPVCAATTPHLITNSSPEVVDGVIYVGTDDGYVLAYEEPPNCSNGTLNLKWTSSTCTNGSCPMDSGLEGPPVVSYNRVYAVSQYGTLYAWHIPPY